MKEQGIAFYRGDVKTFCSSLPTIPNKKRFVVLDDLDLINEQSQQIFRTCIDKYNKSVNFVASCTNPQKVIESLQSRLLSVRIPPLEPRSLKRIADNIIAKENLSLTPEALDYIIMVAQNSARSLINYLEKVALLDKHVDLSLAEALCTDIAWIYFEHYLQFCKSGNVKQAVDILYQFYHQGFSVMDILDNLFVFIKQTQTGLLSEQEVYQLVQILCRHIIMLQEIHVHQVELAFFTCKVIKTISSIV